MVEVRLLAGLGEQALGVVVGSSKTHSMIGAGVVEVVVEVDVVPATVVVVEVVEVVVVVGQGGARVVLVVVVVDEVEAGLIVVVDVVDVVQSNAPLGHIFSILPTGASAPPLASIALPMTPPGVACQVPLVQGKTCWKAYPPQPSAERI